MAQAKLNKEKIHKEFVDHCLAKLLNMMDRVDVVLYRMAKNAKRSSLKRIYTEALRESRQRRKHMMAEFRVQLIRLVEQRDKSDSGVLAKSTPSALFSSTEALRNLLSSGEFDLEEITLDTVENLAELAEISAEEPAALPSDDHHVEFVRRLEKGTWFEFRRDNGIIISRGCFTWRNSVTNVYFFIDQQGHKVAEKTFDELAQDLRCGNAEVIKDVVLGDKVRNKLLAGLRKQANG